MMRKQQNIYKIIKLLTPLFVPNVMINYLLENSMTDIDIIVTKIILEKDYMLIQFLRDQILEQYKHNLFEMLKEVIKS